MKIKLTFIGVFILVLVIGKLWISRAYSGTELLLASSRLLTLEEIRSLEPGFGCESHCETSSEVCDEGDCCIFSAEYGCEFSGQAEKCVETSCGGIFDPCDKECISDAKLDCGRQLIIQCLAQPCYRHLLRVGEYEAEGDSAYGGNCYDLFQCHTVDN